MSLLKEHYAYLSRLLVNAKDDSKTLSALTSNNLSVILSALDAAYASIAPRTAELEGDGDRTVHPAMEDEKQREVNRIVQASLASVPATELLRRVTELEKLANALALRAAGLSSQAEVHSARNAWLKSRAGEWV